MDVHNEPINSFGVLCCPEAYLGPCQIYMIEVFYVNN